MADQNEYFLNYDSQLVDMLGQVMRHPTTGVLLVVVEQTYDAQAESTRLRMIPRN